MHEFINEIFVLFHWSACHLSLQHCAVLFALSLWCSLSLGVISQTPRYFCSRLLYLCVVICFHMNFSAIHSSSITRTDIGKLVWFQTWEVEAGGSGAHNHTQFKVSLDYMRVSQKEKRKNAIDIFMASR